MRAFIVLSCLAFAAARPEAGYSYQRPGGSGGISSGLSGISGSSFGHGGSSFGHGGGGGSFSSGGSSSLSGFGSGGGGGGFSGGGFSGGGFSGGGFSGGGFSGGSSGGAIVQKHIYVHVPPPEPEEIIPQRALPVQQAQKHYKIIFIKAPSPPSYQAPLIPLQPQNEEKTLVYVLVKKPEEQQDIVIPTAAPTQPSKPEVYFIKYKTQKESGGGGGSFASSAGIGGSSFDLSAPGSIGGGSLGGGSIGGGSIGGGSIGGGSIGGGHGGSSSSSGIDFGSSGHGTPSAQYGPPGKSGPY